MVACLSAYLLTYLLTCSCVTCCFHLLPLLVIGARTPAIPIRPPLRQKAKHALTDSIGPRLAVGALRRAFRVEVGGRPYVAEAQWSSTWYPHRFLTCLCQYLQKTVDCTWATIISQDKEPTAYGPSFWVLWRSRHKTKLLHQVAGQAELWLPAQVRLCASSMGLV